MEKNKNKFWLKFLLMFLFGIFMATIFTISGKALPTEPYAYNSSAGSTITLGGDFIEYMLNQGGVNPADYPYVWYYTGLSVGINPNASGSTYDSIIIYACESEPVATVSGSNLYLTAPANSCVSVKMAKPSSTACSGSCVGRYYSDLNSYSDFSYISQATNYNVSNFTLNTSNSKAITTYTRNSNGNVSYESFTERHGYYFGNFDIPVIGSTNYSQYFNIIDYNPSSILLYNPDYLVGNTDYKQVCVGYNELFTILPTELQNPGGSLYVVYDYMLYNKPLYGLFSYQYSNGELSPNSGSQNLIYLDPVSLTAFLSDDDNSYNLSFTGYSSTINNFYGWSFFLNHSIYNTDNTVNQFTAFKINDVFTYKPDCVEVEIDGHTQCVYNSEYFSSEIITNPGTEYCFYIRSDYELHLFNTNAYGDIDDTITIDGHTYSITTDYFELKQDDFNSSDGYKGLINSFLAFLKSATAPIGYVNGFIYKFIKGLPLPLQYLISSIIIGLFLIILVRLFANKH